MAMAVMDVLRSELGLCIPNDVSVVGFDNVPQAAWGAYQLTSVEQPIEQMIEAAATLLLEQLDESDNKVSPRTVVVPCRLVVRASSRAES
jgi:DNA-binding LacI/PurR family transcriptional regulator